MLEQNNSLAVQILSATQTDQQEQTTVPPQTWTNQNSSPSIASDISSDCSCYNNGKVSGSDGSGSGGSTSSGSVQNALIVPSKGHHDRVEDDDLPLCFQAKRHLFPIEGIDCPRELWRIRERMKTVSVALVLCLNIGVDPPDVVKIQPCARLECWIDPSSVSAPKAMELIGANLQKQYERWQPRARYKKYHDPTVEDVKKLCTSLRRNAKEERVLFHYNGHGVPKPTTNGEIWVFNKTYTQYIPLSIYDLQSWMGAPSIYVYDCSNAGIIINSFNQFAEQHEMENEKAKAAAGQRQSPLATAQTITYKNCIQLAACSANQILPMNAQLPADLFTSCLTTPIKTALKWYTMQGKMGLVPQITNDLIDKIPGQLNDRRTMLGELNWIFTAITDTIAWNTLDRELFQKLFRQDLLVASLFRNFLLAERILRSHDCTPISSPPLPQCFRHPMWLAWDLAVDLALQQLPDILENGAPYKQLPFFEEQLTAFQVWLDRESEKRLPPEQLPIVLQVLLSQVHRLRALELLARFLDLGPWAVSLALGVGIFPYVLKLLQSSAKELRPVLVFIWAKILAVDSTCQVDLVKDHKYFLYVLQDTTLSKEHRTLSAFVLSCIVHNFPLGQTGALQGSLVSICLVQLNDDNWLLRQWLVICLGQLWQNFAKARWSGVRDLAHEKLYPLLRDPVPEVRAAAVFALGTFISSVTDRSEEHANNIDRIIAITLLDTVSDDMSPLVRCELVGALQWMVVLFESQFVSVYLQDSFSSSSSSSGGGSPSQQHNHHQHTTHSLERNVNMRRGYSSSSIPSMSTTVSSIPFGSIFLKLWQGIVNLGQDPHPKVAAAAQSVIQFVRNSALCLITAKEATSEKCPNATGSSLSLPPSPNTRTNYLGESPPTSQHHNQMNNSASGAMIHSTSSSSVILYGGGSAGKKTTMNNISRLTSGILTATGGPAPRRNSPRASTPPVLASKQRTSSMNADDPDSSTGHNQQPLATTATSTSSRNIMDTSSCLDSNLRPLIQTNFIPWAISYFARPGHARWSEKKQVDKHSAECRARYQRFRRNEKIRRVAREQQARAIFNRIDSQYWIAKTQFTPSLVKLLPYEQKICVAYKEKVSVYDWVRNTVQSYTPAPSSMMTPRLSQRRITSASPGQITQTSSLQQSSLHQTCANVSSLEFVNGHDVALVLVGYEDGMVRVWKETSSDNETGLVTAWEGLPGVNPLAKDACGVFTTWHQKSQHLVIGGSNKRFLRIWDVNSELKVCDIPTSTESNVRVMSSSPNELIAIGCSDGSVRIFDKRCPPLDARIRTYREHSGAILTACLRDNCESLVSGCSQGKIRLFDIRSRTSSQSWSVGTDVTAIAVHTAADIIACGSQYISIYGFDGRHQTTLRTHEGFMGLKIGQASCLSFHPHKVTLAGGFIDNTVAVYGASGNSRLY